MSTTNPGIAQIKALLQKTVENGCTEAEALTAAAVAQKLISKHRLSMADIQDESSEFGEHFTDGSLESSSRLALWKRHLLASVCKANGCVTCVYSRRGNSTLVVLGTETEAVVVRAFYINLRYLVDATAKRVGSGNGATWLNSFRLGMVRAIAIRLNVSKKESESEATTTALVRVQGQNEDLMRWVERDMCIKKAAPVRGGNMDVDAFLQGRTHGQSVNLSTKVLGS